MNYLFIVLTSHVLQGRKELTKAVSFHSDAHPEDSKAAAAAAAPQAGATAAVTLGSAYVKVSCTSPRS